MDVPADKNCEVDSCNDSDDGKKDSENAKMMYE